MEARRMHLPEMIRFLAFTVSIAIIIGILKANFVCIGNRNFLYDRIAE